MQTVNNFFPISSTEVSFCCEPAVPYHEYVVFAVHQICFALTFHLGKLLYEKRETIEI